LNTDAWKTLIYQTRCYLRHQAEIYGDEIFVKEAGALDSPRESNNASVLDLYKKQIQNCQKCSLAHHRRHFVFGAGNPEARLILIGEAPGEEEDRVGEPFVGKAGQLLDRILAAIDFERDEVFIANILKCRPPQNRDPMEEEIRQCMPHLLGQIEIIRPRIILTLGRVAAQGLLATSESLTRLRGREHCFHNIPMLVTYHPAALLRNPEWKRHTWEDVKQLRYMYDDLIGDKPKWQPPRM
jgi:DNA polymerase